MQEDWTILSPMFFATSTSPQRILDRAGSIAAPLDHEGILKMEVALARLFRCKFVAPDNVANDSPSRSSSAAWRLRRRRRRRRRQRRRRPYTAALLRRPLRAAAAAAAPPPQTSSKWFLFELVRLSAAAIRQLSRELALPSRLLNQVNRGCTLMYQYVLDLKRFILVHTSL
jgi:hypothetical protein